MSNMEYPMMKQASAPALQTTWMGKTVEVVPRIYTSL